MTGLLGAIGAQLGHGQVPHDAYLDQRSLLHGMAESAMRAQAAGGLFGREAPKPKGIRQELQAETNEWLKDVF